MKKFLNLTLLVVLLGVLILPVKTFAADSEGIAAFREALVSDSDAPDRVFRQDIFFVSPFAIGGMSFLGMLDGDTFKTTGEFFTWVDNNDGTGTENIVPFYMTQNGKDMDIYFQTDKQWQKFTAPSLAAVVTDLIVTPTPDEVEEMIADTKEVTVLQDNDYRRVMLVKIDGKKIAESLAAKSDENPADKGTANDGDLQNNVVGYMNTALQYADAWYMWTIDKRDWHTDEVMYNFSGVIQELARAALEDPNQHWSDEISLALETIAFYSEIRAYTTYPADQAAAKKKFDIPKNVLKAKPVKDMISNAALKK